jgi:ribosomal protein L9
MFELLIAIKFLLQEKAVEATKQKEEKREKPKAEEHEGKPKRQEIGTKSTTKSITKTLHKLTSHIPQKTVYSNKMFELFE